MTFAGRKECSDTRIRLISETTLCTIDRNFLPIGIDGGQNELDGSVITQKTLFVYLECLVNMENNMNEAANRSRTLLSYYSVVPLPPCYAAAS
ncbi:unnamed protein product [Angiostrongylus costaricensis]|uniref:Uncharacterized protein n=1 Tax=Angiostrongylus costaricensis TaxID=334426 RepID=A0A0R3PU72_ANGCS|nr:unnamed protein product [Angiostrongylus costaricensis]